MAVKKILKKEPAPTSVTMPVPQADPKLSNSAKRMLANAQAIVVDSPTSYEDAAVVLQTLTAREKEVEARKAELWEPLAKLTKNVQALFNPPLKVLDQAKKVVSGKMGAYALEQRNIAIAKQQEADDAAEEARRKLLSKAERATDDGNHARAVVLEARAESIQAPTIETDIPKVSGIQLRERWLFEVTDPDKVPREFLMVDERLIRAEVNTKESLAKIPGVRIWSTLKPQG
jgi:N-acetylglutamate synthase/N-acetylornithine aminotransferase